MPEFPKKQGSVWTHRFAIYKNGKRVAYPQKSGFETKTACKEWEKEVRQEYQGVSDNLNDITLYRVAQIYGESKQEWKQSTRQGFDLFLRKLRLHFGEEKIRKMTPLDIDGFIEKEKSKQAIYKQIRAVFYYAYRKGAISTNIIDRVDKPISKESKRVAMATSAAIELLDYLRTQDIKLYITSLIAVTIGLRRGELLGLMWSDFDFEQGTVKVQRQWLNHGYIQEGLKNGEDSKTLALDEWVISEVLDYKEYLCFTKQLAPYFYTNPYGKLEDPSSFNRKLSKLIIKGGFDASKITPHVLRHTCATTMLYDAQIDVNKVKEILGHKHLKTTEIYTKLKTVDYIKDDMQKGQRLFMPKKKEQEK